MGDEAVMEAVSPARFNACKYSAARRWRTLPLSRGQHFHTMMGPAAPYWPRLSSMRKSGTPVKKSMMKYGMRNTPVETTNMPG